MGRSTTTASKPTATTAVLNVLFGLVLALIRFSAVSLVLSLLVAYVHVLVKPRYS
jgi:hypothetical protein